MTSDIQEIRVVCFRLGGDMYAADIMRVREITKPLKPAGLPDAPDFIDGVINLRGSVIPVLNLHRRFRLAEPVSDKNTRLLIVSLAGQAFALVVDEVTEVITVPVRDLRPPPQFSRGVESQYLIAVCLVEGSLVMLVNLDSILQAHEVDAVRGVDTYNNDIEDNNQV
ncbi:MAG TPA: chemotaxis protein CheW [Geobacteraceae bacterium]|nr:chemotaxis protein CheW [Geobacteraceae bacterium]